MLDIAHLDEQQVCTNRDSWEGGGLTRHGHMADDAWPGPLQGQIEAALGALASAKSSMRELTSSAEGALEEAAASHKAWQGSLVARSNR
jgi:hypothetical protein